MKTVSHLVLRIQIQKLEAENTELRNRLKTISLQDPDTETGGREHRAQKQAQNSKLQYPDTEAGGREDRAQKQAQISKSSSLQDPVTEAGGRELRNRMKTVRKSSSPQDPCRYRSWRLEILGSEIGIKAIVIYQHQDTEARVL